MLMLRKPLTCSRPRVVSEPRFSDRLRFPRTGRGWWLAGSRIPRGVPGSPHHLPRVPTLHRLIGLILMRCDRCRSFSIYFAGDDRHQTGEQGSHAALLCAGFAKQGCALRDVSGMTVSLFALQELQPVYVQDFDCSRCDPPDEALAFQSRECAFRGLGYCSKIIRKIEAVHR